MGTLTIIVHLPEAMLIAPLFGTGKALRAEAFLIVGAIAALNDAIAPRARFFDEGVNAPVFFDGLRKRRFAFRVRRILHREVHRIIRKGYEKGGSASSAR